MNPKNIRIYAGILAFCSYMNMSASTLNLNEIIIKVIEAYQDAITGPRVFGDNNSKYRRIDMIPTKIPEVPFSQNQVNPTPELFIPERGEGPENHKEISPSEKRNWKAIRTIYDNQVKQKLKLYRLPHTRVEPRARLC